MTSRGDLSIIIGEETENVNENGVQVDKQYHKHFPKFTQKTLIANQHECTIKLCLNPLILNEKFLKSKQN